MSILQFFNIEITDSSLFHSSPNPVRMAEWFRVAFTSVYQAILEVDMKNVLTIPRRSPIQVFTNMAQCCLTSVIM